MFSTRKMLLIHAADVSARLALILESPKVFFACPKQKFRIITKVSPVIFYVFDAVF